MKDFITKVISKLTSISKRHIITGIAPAICTHHGVFKSKPENGGKRFLGIFCRLRKGGPRHGRFWELSLVSKRAHIGENADALPLPGQECGYSVSACEHTIVTPRLCVCVCVCVCERVSKHVRGRANEKVSECVGK